MQLPERFSDLPYYALRRPLHGGPAGGLLTARRPHPPAARSFGSSLSRYNALVEEEGVGSARKFAFPYSLSEKNPRRC